MDAQWISHSAERQSYIVPKEKPPARQPNVALVDVLDFINRDDCEHIGLAGIAAYLREHSVTVDLFSVVTGESTDQLVGAGSRRYALYGFSIYPNTALDVIRQATAIKGRYPGALVCVGGQLATAAAREILEEGHTIDFVVRGDGEDSMLEVVRALAEGKSLSDVQSVVTRGCDPRIKQSVPVELSSLPLPARDLFPLSARRGNNTARINSSLGCAAACTFCSVNGYYDAQLSLKRNHHGLPIVNGAIQPAETALTPRKKWRARTIEQVFGEIVGLNQKLGVRSFVFNDASFEDPGRAGKERVRQFCELVRESGLVLAFRCAIRAESFKSGDESLLSLMRSTGFTHIFIGIEAGNLHDLQVFQKIATVQDNERIIGLLKGCGIDLTMGFIMLNPLSTFDTVRENYRFLLRHGAFNISHYIGKVHVYFGTALHRDLSRAGLLTADFSYRNPYGYRFSESAMTDLDELLEEVRCHPAVGKQSGRMYSLAYKLSELRALFPEDIQSLTEEFSSLCAQMASLFAGYFELLFERGDFARARGELPAFVRALENQCTNLESFSLRLVYNRAFRDYFLQHGQGRRRKTTPIIHAALSS